jgi:archaeosine synthase
MKCISFQMEFNVKNRDGPARTGELLIGEDKRVSTPNILFIETSRFKAPDFADVLITYGKQGKPTLSVGKDFSSLTMEVNDYLVYPKDMPLEMHLDSLEFYKKKKSCYVVAGVKEIIDDALIDNDALLFIVANAHQLFFQISKFVEFITELRRKTGYQKMMYVPSVGDPSCFALLAYMGVDFFDSTQALVAARNNVLLLPTGRYYLKELKEIPCSCPSCKDLEPPEMGFTDILNHNYYALSNELRLVRNSIASGNIRELVESRVRVNPLLSGMLRILDLEYYYSFLEERTPVVRKKQLLATTKDSLFRPEVRRFQERIVERYEKPSSAKVLLLLPCSAKKPYSFSKSHKLLRESLFRVDNPYVVHEVIITSPLGVVPRELELTYPASLYDVAVTGHWDEDEKKMIRDLLRKYLKVNEYDRVILHLPRVIQDFITDLLMNPVITCVDSPISKESLDELSKVLEDLTGAFETVDSSVRVLENVKSLARYQFGGRIAEQLLDGCRIKGRYPYLRIFYGNSQLGMLTKERGLISLTLEGAKRVAGVGSYWVEIHNGFMLKGSVLAPGVKDADESIRVGDEVVILKNNELCGVGVAQMNGREMKELNHGEAVKVRHVSAHSFSSPRDV